MVYYVNINKSVLLRHFILYFNIIPKLFTWQFSMRNVSCLISRNVCVKQINGFILKSIYRYQDDVKIEMN